MFVESSENIKAIDLNASGIANVVKQSLIGPNQGWEGWVMRLFTIGKDGHTPRHTHTWPHINYIVSGEGTLFLNGKEHMVTSGFVAYIPGNAEHQFTNHGEQDFSFICIVPEEGDK